MDHPAHEAFVRGARLFDQRAFFEAHEAWEERWLVETDGASKRLLQGLIQVAAGFHKLISMHDGASAARLLAKGLAKLEGYPELAGFRERVREYASTLALGGFDPTSLPKLGV